MKLNIKAALLFSAFLFFVCNISAQTYNDGPMTLEIKVTGMQVDYHPDDNKSNDFNLSGSIGSILGGVITIPSLESDEISAKVWSRDNLGAPWQGGVCIQGDLPMSAGGPESFTAAPGIMTFSYAGSQVPQFFELKVEAWEDEKPDDFDAIPGGIPFVFSNDCQTGDGYSSCVFEGNSDNCATLFGSGVLPMEDDLHCDADPFQTNLDYRAAGPPCRWNSHGYVVGNCPSNNYYRPQIESRYRFTGGADCPTALDLGPLNLGGQLTHFNSTECYNNTFASSPGNDVFYKFTINNPIGVSISTSNGLTNFDTYVYLLYNGCAVGDLVNSNDDGPGGVQSLISATLCNTGTYYVVVDGKTAGDFGPFQIVIGEDPLLTFAAVIDTTNPTKFSNPSCFGEDDGFAEVDIIGGTDPFSIVWSNGLVDDTINDGLIFGTYSVIVTDYSGCQATDTVTLRDPAPLDVFVTTTDLTCSGQNDGTAKAHVSGGITPYRTLIWNNGLPGDTLANLVAGTYSITVSDFEFCTATASGTVSANNPIIIRVDSTFNIRCNGEGNGAIYVTGLGGVPSYTYIWDPTVSFTSSATNLVPGEYKLSVYDATNGGGLCFEDTTFDITEPQVLVSSIASIRNITCFDGNDGGVDLEVSGGTLPYNYLWSDGSTRGDLLGSKADTVSVQVFDKNGCATSSDTILTQPSAINPLITVLTNAGCSGSAEGSIDLDVTGGTPPYIYNWSPNNEITQDISNLPAGNYSVAITDDGTCVEVADTTISESSDLTVQQNVTNPSCIGKEDGSISLTPSGTAPFSFIWDNGSTDQSLTDLPPGSYTVTVTDASSDSCSTVVTIPIADPTTNCEGGTYDVAVPNVFSPNDDDLNDYFDIFRSDDVSKVSVKIYDRWGAKIYENPDQQNGSGKGWDGTAHGKDAQVGAYVYVMEIEYSTPNTTDRPTQKTGTITVIK